MYIREISVYIIWYLCVTDGATEADLVFQCLFLAGGVPSNINAVNKKLCNGDGTFQIYGFFIAVKNWILRFKHLVILVCTDSVIIVKMLKIRGSILEIKSTPLQAIFLIISFWNFLLGEIQWRNHVLFN